MSQNPRLNLAKATQRYIHMSNVAKAAKILSRNSNGTYSVETLDGLTLNNVKNQTATKWQEDQWVTAEFMGGDYMITGLSAHRGGD